MATAASAGPSPRSFQSPSQRITAFEPPSGWDRAATPPSVRLLATWSHRDGGRLTLAVDHVAAGVDASRVYDESRPSLEKQGWTIAHAARTSAATSTRVVVEASLDGGRRAAHQLYLVDAGSAYVVTMVAPTDQPERAHEFDETVASLRLGEAPKK